MSLLSKSKCWYSKNCLHFLEQAIPLLQYHNKLECQALWVTYTLVLYLQASLRAYQSVTSSQAPRIASKYWIKVEVTVSGKHSSLLRWSK